MKVDLFYDEAERVTKFRTLEDETLQFCGKDFTLKAGFVSDGASVPRILWGICTPLDAKFIRSFLKHDARLPAPSMLQRRDRQRAPGRPEGRRNVLCGEAFGLHRREGVRRLPLVEPYASRTGDGAGQRLRKFWENSEIFSLETLKISKRFNI